VWTAFGLTIKRNRELDKSFFVRKKSLMGAISHSGSHSPRNLIVYDVGAHVGDTLDDFRDTFPAARIYAFDARKESVATLENRFFGLQNVSVHHAVLSDHSDEDVYFWTPRADEGGGSGRFASIHQPNFASHTASSHRGINRNRACVFEFGEGAWRKTSVRTVTLDDFVEKNHLPLPNVVKIDVQGHDVAVLSGARKALSHASVLLTEVIVDDIYSAPESLAKLFALTEESGLRLWDISHIYKDLESMRTLWFDAVFFRPSEVT
jgi:FkbM family methyltransferase